MDVLKLHVLLNYYPAIGVVIATIALATGLWFRNTNLTRFTLKSFVFLAVLTVVVVFAGEIAGWATEWYSGPRKAALTSHRITATIAFAATTLTGIAAVVALIRGRSVSERGRWAAFTTLVLGVIASVILVTTIFKGRQVKWADTTATPGIQHIS